MKSWWAPRLLFAVLVTMFVGVFALVCTLPFMLNTFAFILRDAYLADPGYRSFLLFFLMAVAALALWVLGEMVLMVRTVTEDPFVPRNVSALRRVAIAAVGASALFLLKSVAYFTILTAVCSALLAIGALCAATLAGLFLRAVRFKQENDLTI